MQLRNKKTGEIKELRDIMSDMIDNHIVPTLIAIESEWEYAPEEPKEYWCIDCFSPDDLISEVTGSSSDILENRKSIGNYFETEEEAEKAVEKLKAIKILKDSGFRFIEWELDMRTIADGKIWFDVGVNTQWDAVQLLEQKPEVKEALDLLFGGEE